MHSWIEDRKEWLAACARLKHKPFQAHCARWDRWDVGVLLPLSLCLCPRGVSHASGYEVPRFAHLLICSSSSMKRSKFRHSCNGVVMINSLHPKTRHVAFTVAHSTALRLVPSTHGLKSPTVWLIGGRFVCPSREICVRVRTYHNFFWSLPHDLFPISQWSLPHLKMGLHQFPMHSNCSGTMRRLPGPSGRRSGFFSHGGKPDLPRTWQGLLCQHGNRSKA